MNIRSIDLQVLIPRTTEASKNQDVFDHQLGSQQQFFADELRQAAAHRQAQVQSSPKGEGGRVEAEGQKERRGTDKRRRDGGGRQNSKDNSLPEDEEPFLGHHIDIKT